MAPHSSTLAWKIPWMDEPGGLQSMGSLRVRNNWVTSLSLFTFMHWRRKWQPTPMFLPGESQGQGSLVGCCLWGCLELDMTEATQQQQQQQQQRPYYESIFSQRAYVEEISGLILFKCEFLKMKFISMHCFEEFKGKGFQGFLGKHVAV